MATDTRKMVRVNQDLWSRVTKTKEEEGFTWSRFFREMYEAWLKVNGRG